MVEMDGLDAVIVNVAMKKGRPGIRLEALVRDADLLHRFSAAMRLSWREIAEPS